MFVFSRLWLKSFFYHKTFSKGQSRSKNVCVDTVLICIYSFCIWVRECLKSNNHSYYSEDLPFQNMSCISSPAVSSYILTLNYQFKLFQMLCLNTFDPAPMTGDLSFSPTLRNPNWHLQWLWFNPALCGDKEERGEKDFFFFPLTKFDLLKRFIHNGCNLNWNNSFPQDLTNAIWHRHY